MNSLLINDHDHDYKVKSACPCVLNIAIAKHTYTHQYKEYFSNWAPIPQINNECQHLHRNEHHIRQHFISFVSEEPAIFLPPGLI